MDFAQMDRRALMARVLALLGAGAASSACAATGVIEPAVAPANPRLTAEQFAALRALAERIIPATDTPGAALAGVPERLDGMMATWAAPATRAQILRKLAEIDALGGPGRPFASLPAAEQHRLLAAYDAQAMQPSGAVEHSFVSARSIPVDPEYGRLKDLIVTLYYLSQAAMTQELVYTHVPGRWDHSIPVTPATRPWGSTGFF